MTEEEREDLFIKLRQSGKTELQTQYMKIKFQKEFLKIYLDRFGMTSMLYLLSEIIKEEYEKNPEVYLSDLLINLTKTATQYNERNEGRSPE